MTNDLTFTGKIPVVINRNGSAEDLFAPVRSSSCDINIVSERLLDDLYTPDKDSVKVKIEKDIYGMEKSQEWVDKDWNINLDGRYVWKDNDGHIYYSRGYTHYELVNGTWVNKTWNVDYISGRNVWKDNDGHIHSDIGVYHYELVNGTWVNKTWNIILNGQFVWKDNDGHIYYSLNYDDYKLVDGEWVVMKWHYYLSDFTVPFAGEYVWRDNDGNVYLSKDSSHQYILTRGNVWIDKNWEGFTPNYGFNVWRDNDGHIYYNNGSTQYELVDGTWVHKTWNMTFNGQFVWRDNDGNIYHNREGDEIISSSSLVLADRYERTLQETVPVWEGYMTPNTYTQQVSQNLDEISLTCIDPVSLLKYIHIDRIMTKPNVVDYATLIGRSLSAVKLDADLLYVEKSVNYGNTEALLDMRCQVSNFWDEAGEPSDLYTMIEELLRIFGLSLVFTGTRYVIHSVIKDSTEQTRTYRRYRIEDDGTLTYLDEVSEDITVFRFEDGDWISNNVTDTSMAINETYDKVTGVASTSIPVYSQMAMDLIDAEDIDKYDARHLNVQRNKAKGYVPKGYTYAIDSNDYWYYLWNGVYVNDYFGLELHNNDDVVDGWDNINKAFHYLTGLNGRPTETGSILNFYGGANNPTGTGKEQVDERSVDIRKRITRFSWDNGIPPEFLDEADILWTYDANFVDGTHEDPYTIDPQLIKTDYNDVSKWGLPHPEAISSTITYHQEYPNMTLIQGSQQTLDFNLTQSYSRTGVDVAIPVMATSRVENREFRLLPDNSGEGSPYYIPILENGEAHVFPDSWLAENVVVNTIYFNRYNTSKGLKAVWDKRRIDLYIKLEDGTIYQFNGKEWVEDTQVRAANAFYLKRLMNDEKIFHNDFRYDLIECSDSTDYALNEEGFEYWHDGDTITKKGKGSQVRIPYYLNQENDWTRYVEECSEGYLSITLPDISAINVSVFTDVHNSTLLGMTGMSNPASISNRVDYEVSGMGKRRLDDWEWEDGYPTLMTADNTEMYGSAQNMNATLVQLTVPYSATYIKAEHLDLSIEVSVPQSNLGQVFGQSDIKYTIDEKKGYLEQYEGPTFRINTKHPLVMSSYSYLISGNEIANPEDFAINGTPARPECFVVQAYKNFLSKIRKIYSKTVLLLKGKELDTVNKYITTPELGTGDKTLVIASDSWDLQTGRHTIEAVEDKDIKVSRIQTISATEVPHKARNDRWNLPSVKK